MYIEFGALVFGNPAGYPYGIILFIEYLGQLI